ncbi:unnamed protein product [Cuscuta europaea]|uniref:Uncharacterized protein n=1 Tax=Cuscuta europaea TaxID=41803 RepID=A0A9P0YN98_CUSEU|nr:unnamed protein product [Cuscuta europaea]
MNITALPALQFHPVLNDMIPPPSPAIPHDQLPTAEHVVMELKHLGSVIQEHQRGLDIISTEELAERIRRNHRIVSRYSQTDGDVVTIAQQMQGQMQQMQQMQGQMQQMQGQMQQMQGQMQQMQQMQGQITDQITALTALVTAQNGQLNAIAGQITGQGQQIELLSVRLDASAARAHNSANTSNALNLLRPIVKTIPNHPDPQPHPAFHFNENSYAIGTPPPDGLVPHTFEAVNAIDSHNQFDAIYWFYNDAKLARGDKNLIQRRSALATFMKS